MLLDDIADYLSSQASTSWVVGTNLFKGALPPKPDACVVVYETAGLPTIHAMNPAAGQAKAEQVRIQVVSRALQEDYAAARLAAHRAFMVLDGLPRRTINGCEYMWGAAIQSPFLMGRDADNRPLIVFNVDIAKRLSTG